MIILLSPAKTFSKHHTDYQSEPMFYEDTLVLLRKLKKLSKERLKSSMKLSDALTEQVYTYYHTFGTYKSQAIHLYSGHVFRNLDPKSLSEEATSYMRNHLLILSGLYGWVRPFDGISKYRLELKSHVVGNLYTYWKNQINDYLDQLESPMIINLMSEEYSKILKQRSNLYHIDFFEFDGNTYKSNAMEMKKMRGLMARYLLEHPITSIRTLKKIEIDGYLFNQEKSDAHHYIYVKEI